jgi:hypothetical protein
VFGETAAGLEMLALSIVAFAWIGRSFRTAGTTVEKAIYLPDTRRSG